MTNIFDFETCFSKRLPVNKEYDDVGKIFEKSYGSDNVCISSIFKITNPMLIEQFDKQQQTIKTKRGIKPQIINVFHGTSAPAVKNIIMNGFDPSYSRITAFGKGTYASPRIKTALQYCKDSTQKALHQ